MNDIRARNIHQQKPPPSASGKQNRDCRIAEYGAANP
jgi:hypothetical protein